jgi:hypothetical protein
MPNNYEFIAEGTVVGRLTVGPLVYDVRNHPLLDSTRCSYISQGRLHECTCICGNVILLSENILRAKRVQSCGCLKQEMAQKAYEERVKLADRVKHKKEINYKLSNALDFLKVHLRAPVEIRNEKLIEELGAEIRKLRAMKAYANRKA